MSFAIKEDYQNILGDVFKDLIINAVEKTDYNDYVEYIDKFWEFMF